MRLFDLPSPLLLLLLPTLSRTVSAALVPNLFLDEDSGRLEPRFDLRKRCDGELCGYKNWLCCPAGATCYTDYNDDAQCSYGPATTAADSGAGSWVYFTTTYVKTNLETVTIVSSSFSSCANPVTVITTVECEECGGYSTITSYAENTNTATPAVRPTSATTVSVTATGEYTTAYQTPVSTAGIISGVQSSSSGGLSGGAIAGIVIGVIAAIIILLIICLCCCAKELLEGILGLFGLGRRRTVREEEIIERRSHRGGTRTWFGTGPSRVDRVEEKRRTSGWGEWLGVAGGLAALAAILGLKRRRDRRDEKASTVSYDYSYDSYSYTSPSK